ncbi:MAG TPA: hypothetical protein VH306_12515 [Gaiellaceae bacterium]|jgi:hypothetical protein
MTVHSVLPRRLAEAAGNVLRAAGIEHELHDDRDPMAAAEQAVADPAAVALIGPYRSAAIAEVVEATAPAELPLIAPVATWAGVTRDDEPGCDDAAQSRGTVVRLVARDTVVAARIAEHVRASGGRALVVAGDHDYGLQLDGQLRLAGLPRADGPERADVLVLAGLEGEPEIERAAALAPLPILAFDGVQGAGLGEGRDVLLALPFEPVEGVSNDDLFAGVEHARRAARLVAAAIDERASDRASMLAALRALGRFDEYGDPIDPPVWLWRAGPGWPLEPERALAR